MLRSIQAVPVQVWLPSKNLALSALDVSLQNRLLQPDQGSELFSLS